LIITLLITNLADTSSSWSAMMGTASPSRPRTRWTANTRWSLWADVPTHLWHRSRYEVDHRRVRWDCGDQPAQEVHNAETL